jgi:hypothetical protein
MLAVVSRFKWMHIDYLAALAEHFDLMVAWADEAHEGAVARALKEGMRGVPVGAVRTSGAAAVRAELQEALRTWRPEVVHVMYYRNEEITLLVRELVEDHALVVHECRDPLSTLDRGGPGSEDGRLEREALSASDAQIFVSEAVRSYLEESHGLDLRGSSLIVPQGFSQRTIGPPSQKLSAVDGRVHIALLGTANHQPDHDRWYGDIIRRLVSLGLVVDAHFHDLETVSLEPYEELSTELEDFHLHPTLNPRHDTHLSETLSRYDLNGVFHELGATRNNESATLAVCMPTKAVCGWLHGGLPAVCFSHYRGLVERIRNLGIGFVIDRWEDLGEIASDRAAIAEATERCLSCRDVFTNEHNAERIRRFIEPRLARVSDDHPRRDLVERA